MNIHELRILILLIRNFCSLILQSISVSSLSGDIRNRNKARSLLDNSFDISLSVDLKQMVIAEYRRKINSTYFKKITNSVLRATKYCNSDFLMISAKIMSESHLFRRVLK